MLWPQELGLAPSLGFGPLKRPWAPSDLGTVLRTAVSHGRHNKALQCSMQVTAILKVYRTEGRSCRTETFESRSQGRWPGFKASALPGASETQSKLPCCSLLVSATGMDISAHAHARSHARSHAHTHTIPMQEWSDQSSSLWSLLLKSWAEQSRRWLSQSSDSCVNTRT